MVTGGGGGWLWERERSKGRSAWGRDGGDRRERGTVVRVSEFFFEFGGEVRDRLRAGVL